jgi:hypothetical protein
LRRECEQTRNQQQAHGHKPTRPWICLGGAAGD